MNSYNTIKVWMRGACFWYTLISLGMLIFGLMFSNNANNVTTVSFLLFFPCALCISAAGMLCRNEKIGKGLRALLHYLITVFAFVIFIWLPSGATATFPFILLLLLLITAIYWLIRLALHILRSFIKRLREGK
ncbi:MAG: hypothetical protein IJX80_10510 [Clostridia bacterium]|nr:hypothetical protein [Clostridia bacterium]